MEQCREDDRNRLGIEMEQCRKGGRRRKGGKRSEPQLKAYFVESTRNRTLAAVGTLYSLCVTYFIFTRYIICFLLYIHYIINLEFFQTISLRALPSSSPHFVVNIIIFTLSTASAVLSPYLTPFPIILPPSLPSSSFSLPLSL
uniref:Uncharacterized protein n=1 Tax=Cacopsylla melanoneura TaxID=428564 RepID=A0A8D8X4U6_9HEMI